jgi:hypothetical protein
VQELYAYAAELMVTEKKSPLETQHLLIEQGLDNETAAVIVSNLESEIKAAKRKQANNDMLYGALWAIGGVIATGATYAAAEDGGSYVAFYGAIVYGGYRFLKGVFSSF